MTTMRGTRAMKALAAAFAAVVLLGAAACGGDDDDDAVVGGDENGDGENGDGENGGDENGGDENGGDGEELVLEGIAFPDGFTVSAGATVSIVNEDGVPHTVTSEEGGFDVDVDANGTADLAAPDEPGEYDTICEIHPGMTTTITVE